MTFKLNSKFTTWVGVLVTVAAVFADNAHLLPEDWRNVIVLASVLVAAIGRSLLPSPPVSTDVSELRDDL
jgi:hypothetical protein